MAEGGQLGTLLLRTAEEGCRRLAALPFFIALRAGTLPSARFADHLRAMAIVHATLEHALATASDPALKGLREAYPSRLALLLADLAAVDEDGLRPDDPAASGAARVAASALLLASAERPARLIGHLVALERAPAGNASHEAGARVSAGSGAGTSWYSAHGGDSGQRRRRLVAALDQLDLDQTGRLDAAQGVGDALASLERIHAALDPGSPAERRFQATSFNPEAGSHAVPSDPALVAAAVRAADRCLAEFPYLSRRWGERGARYTRSDAAWLATLSTLDEEAARRQVAWLAGLLARRGLPTLLLERQLDLLAEEAGAALFGTGPGRLARAARVLRERRDRALPPEAAAPLLALFVETAGTGTAAEREGTALLLLAAVADEASGLAGTLSATSGWLRNAVRSASWEKAVDTLLAGATAASRG